MNLNIWGFLTVSAIFGILFAMFVIYTSHKKTLKQLEIEALKNKMRIGKLKLKKP